ncbi:MAG: DGQHR domain-containing protein [Candidatus Binatia bacterium]
MAAQFKVNGFILQKEPQIYLTSLPGRWLLKRCTPSWRIRDPQKGFQRVVKEERAREIAVAVLDQSRTFPNAIVLATNVRSFNQDNGTIGIPQGTRFLVVDGQHRLWAQTFSDHEAMYGCVIHMGLSEVDMARLFLEINDNQKRVPSSLRWDLVRLVRPEDDPYAIEASELVWELANDRASPLYQRVDLTGEQNKITLKQGSLAPELKTLISSRTAGFRNLDFDKHYEILIRYLAAIRALDPDGWKASETPFYNARVLRVLIRLLPELSKKISRNADQIPTTMYKEYLDRIDRRSLFPEAIRAAQGSAGMKEIYELIKTQLRL